VVLFGFHCTFAQGTPPNPQSKPGATIVINPTEEECHRGWNATMKWTQEQFEETLEPVSQH